MYVSKSSTYLSNSSLQASKLLQFLLTKQLDDMYILSYQKLRNFKVLREFLGVNKKFDFIRVVKKEGEKTTQ